MSITGQNGHIALAVQSAFGTPNITPADYRAIKITGDSLVASNNQLVANNEIGTGRDITAAIPGGFSAAGSLNGDLRVRSLAVGLEGALGSLTPVVAASGPPATVAYDDFEPADLLPLLTLEKQVGSAVRSASELLTLQYTDCMINTLNLTVPSAAFATYSLGIIACGEKYLSGGALIPDPHNTPWDSDTNPAGYQPASDDILAFYGGRLELQDSQNGEAVTWTPGSDENDTFQSFEVAINNNVAADEFTVRPSRFLRSLTEGIRAIDLNMTKVFTNFADYQTFTYGAAANTTPGYQLYFGAIKFFLGNWQIIAAEDITAAVPTGAPTSPSTAQAVEVHIPKAAFAAFPVTLSTGRIVVTFSASALKPTAGSGSAGNIMQVFVRPTGAGF